MSERPQYFSVTSSQEIVGQLGQPFEAPRRVSPLDSHRLTQDRFHFPPGRLRARRRLARVNGGVQHADPPCTLPAGCDWPRGCHRCRHCNNATATLHSIAPSPRARLKASAVGWRVLPAAGQRRVLPTKKRRVTRRLQLIGSLRQAHIGTPDRQSDQRSAVHRDPHDRPA